MTVTQIKRKITRAFKKYMAAPERKAFDAIPKSLTSGKLYEAYVVGLVAEKLTDEEGYELKLSAGTKLQLRASGGPIYRKYPSIDAFRNSQKVAELWTDIEFLTLSYRHRGSPLIKSRGDMHELDIVMVPPELNGYPPHDVIQLGVECKRTDYTKSLLKEILGVRRELSLLAHPMIETSFTKWPCNYVPANPPSCLLVYSTDERVLEYKSPGDTFGIIFYHEPL